MTGATKRTSRAERAAITDRDSFDEAVTHCEMSAEMDLRHQGMALRDFAIPALKWAGEVLDCARSEAAKQAPEAVEPPLLRDFAGSTEDALRMALQMLYDDTADYIQRNNLGAMNNHAMRLAREALSRPSAPVVESGKMRAALESIARNICCDGCQEAARVARAALGHQSEAVAQPRPAYGGLMSFPSAAGKPVAEEPQAEPNWRAMRICLENWLNDYAGDIEGGEADPLVKAARAALAALTPYWKTI